MRSSGFIHLPQSGLAILDGRLVKAEATETLINVIEKYSNIPPGKTAAEIISLYVGWGWRYKDSQKKFMMVFHWYKLYKSIEGLWDVMRETDGRGVVIDPSSVIIMMRKVRLIQQTWRAHIRSRRTRTLALFMGTHKRLRTDPWLDLVLTALCIPERKSLV